jgi:hypothetical protein
VNQACPVCGTQFKVGPNQVGAQFPCFNCQTPLTVTSAGIQAAGGAPSTGPMPAMPAMPMSPEPPATRPAAALTVGPGGPSWWRRVDGPTWLFALGALLVILYLFLPLINTSKARRIKGKIDLGDMREKKAEEDFKKVKDAATGDQAKRALDKDKWLKDRAQLEVDQNEASAEASVSEYWYTWGMMFGFMLLAGAALGYLDPSQPTIRRVVGAIVLSGQVLLILIRYILK